MRAPRVVIVYNNVPLGDLAGPEPVDEGSRAFVHAMRDLGWHADRNVSIRFLSTEGKFDRMPALMKQLANGDADVIVASGAAANAAKGATGTIPIVALIPDAEWARLAGDSPDSRRNFTAVTSDIGTLMPKRLELLKAIAPRSSRVAVLTDDARASAERTEIEAGARRLGLAVAWIEVEQVGRLEEGLAQVLSEKADAIAVDDTRVNFARRKTIADFALQNRLPTVTPFDEFVEAGGLMAYGANTEEQMRRAASYVDKILKGAKPADLPVVRPTVFDLTVNARTAKALGLAIPPPLQLRITRTIE